jgi:predicted transcriptional regulator
LENLGTDCWKKTDINVFQKTILEFLHIGHQDRQELAQWIGVDIELINLIIDTELVPRGLIQIDLKDKKITLTPKGVQTLDDEIERTEDLQAYYLVQDAITGNCGIA